MAQITITGVIEDSQNEFPTSGTISFTLNDWFIDSNGDITIPKAESATISPSTGAFSIVLESTSDAIPATRYYTAQVDVTIDGVAVSKQLGNFSLPASPASQTIQDLLITGIATPAADTTGVHVEKESVAGTKNGVNTAFTIASTPLGNSVIVFYRAVGSGHFVTLLEGSGFSRAGVNLTLDFAPVSGDDLIAYYRRAS